MKYLFYIVLLACGIGIGLWIDGCESGDDSDAVVYDTSGRSIDTSEHTKESDDVMMPWEVPVYLSFQDDSIVYRTRYRDTGSTDTLYREKDFKIDTAALIADYFRNRKGKIEWQDSLIKAKFKYWIWRNKLQDYSFEYNFRQPMTKASNLNEDPKHRIYLGGMIGGNSNAFSYGPQAVYLKDNFGATATWNVPRKSVLIGPVFLLSKF